MDLISELRRRRVHRTALVYVASIWVVIQVAEIVFSAFNATDRLMQMLIIVGILGFPIVLVFGWLYQLTPEGIQRTPTHAPEDATPSVHRKTVNFTIITLLVVALLLMTVDNYVLSWLPADEVSESNIPSRSIAVLPFTNHSPEVENAENAETFATGMHADLLTLLSKLRGLRVISRNSVDRFKGSDLSLQEIADALGTDRILEGGVQQAGDRVRVNVQLVDVRTDRTIWAETYDRELTAVNVFEIQAEIAEQIAGALQTRLTAAERSQLTRVPTDNLEAYRAHLLGKERLKSLSTANLEQAIEHFQRAISLDPDFAAAYIGLADAYLYLIDFGALDEREAVLRATPFIDTALQLEPTSGEAHVTLGTLRFYEFDYPGAEQAYLKALELKPNYVPAHQWYADLLTRMGRPERALDHLREGLLLDPLSPGLAVEIVDALAALTRYTEALAELDDVIEMDPTNQLSYWRVARINAVGLGRFDEALHWMEKSLAIDPTDAFGSAFVALLYAALGDMETADTWVDRALDLGPDSSFALTAAALLASRRGDTEAVASLSSRIISARGLNGYARALAMLRDQDLSAGRAPDAVDRYRRHFPELFIPDAPTIDTSNYEAATGLAILMQWVGDTDQAALLNTQILSLIDDFPRTGWAGYRITDARLHAVLGRTDEALAALREAVDSGWRPLLDVPLASDPCFASLRGEPAFEAVLAEIEADMAAQLSNVRAARAEAAI